MIAFIVRITAHPGQREALENLTTALFTELSGEEAFVSATVRRAHDAPDDLIAYEVWNEGKAAFMQRLQTGPVFQTHEARMGNLIASRDITFMAHPPVWTSEGVG